MKNHPIVLSWLAVFFVAFCICREPQEATAGTDANTIEPNSSTEPNSPAEPNSSANKLKTQNSELKTIEVAVTVNGVDITEGEVEANIKPMLEMMTAQGAKTPPQFIEQYKKQIRQQALDSMIIELLLDEQVKANKIAVTEEDALGYLKEMSSSQGLSLEDTKALIAARGQSFDEVKRQTRKGMGYQKLMISQFAGKINVTDDDAKKYYSEHKSEFETPEQVRASHILIKPDTSDPNTDPNDAEIKAKEKAQRLLKQIKDGADFATLARANSACPSSTKGGDLNFFNRGQMVPAFDKVAFELKVGQVSECVQTQFGYHIIKVTDRKEADIKAFEQAKDDIIKMLTQKKQSEAAEEYINSLKAKANIAYPPGKEPKKSIIDKE